MEHEPSAARVSGSLAAIAVAAVLALCGFARAPLAPVAPERVAQDPPPEAGEARDDDEAPQVVPEKVGVAPAADDEEIATRLKRILLATRWFEDASVRVEDGVAFLAGRADSQEHKEWAGRLASNTRDVVAVVNRMDVRERAMWDLSEAWQELRELAGATIRHSPLLVVGLLLLAATWIAMRWSVRGVGAMLQRRLRSQLLRNVVSRLVAFLVLVLGIYVVLRVSGLSRLALTVIGSTGLLGLVIGFAFRDIAENFLASILISMQHPFATGDLIEVDGHKGFVQSVNMRSTLLMTLEGNHVQIPNAAIYKGTIVNFTANPLMRLEFVVGIGYDDSVAHAQSVALSVLREHRAVIDDPEPLVLVEELASATVRLRVFFWVNIVEHSQLKVRSAVLRLTKLAFQEAGISMPDEAREVVFPSDVPVRILPEAAARESKPRERRPRESDSVSHPAEGELESEAVDIREQAARSRAPEAGVNLLES